MFQTRSLAAIPILAAIVLALPAGAEGPTWFSANRLSAEASPGGHANSLRVLGEDDGEVAVTIAWFPPSTDIEPHGAIDAGNAMAIAVISGDFALGMGDGFDESGLVTLPPGSMAMLNHDHATHFARTGPAGAQVMLISAPEDRFAEPLRIAD